MLYHSLGAIDRRLPVVAVCLELLMNGQTNELEPWATNILPLTLVQTGKLVYREKDHGSLQRIAIICDWHRRPCRPVCCLINVLEEALCTRGKP